MGDNAPPNGSPSLMRAINAARVIREIRAAGPISRAGLVRATSLSKPTITNVVAHLEDLGYIERLDREADAVPSREARAPLYEYRASRGHVLGIDIGADKTLVLLADLSGTILGSKRFTTEAVIARGPSQIFEEIAKATKALLDSVGASADTLLSVVVGTPGVISPDGVVTVAPQLEGWEGLNLRAAMEELFDCPIAIDSEVSLSLQAERWVGVAVGVDDALFVQLGVGVGAGLLVNGQIHRGANGAAGEIGLMPYPMVGAAGEIELVTMESLAGGGALLRQGQALARRPEGKSLRQLAGGDPDKVDASTVFMAMRDGDPAATALVNEIVRLLGWAIASVVCAFNPQVVIIGGGLSRAADQFLPRLQNLVAASVPFPPAWFVSSLGDEAVALGAVHNATAMVEADLFETPSVSRRV
jgi:predicted NBD/HSP70 family sugar kinase